MEEFIKEITGKELLISFEAGRNVLNNKIGQAAIEQWEEDQAYEITDELNPHASYWLIGEPKEANRYDYDYIIDGWYGKTYIKVL